MPFLILTRAGFDDLVASVAPSGAVFHINPGVATDEELARLRDAGTAVHILAPRADPHKPQHVEHALQGAAGDGATVWIERTTAKAKSAGQGAPPAADAAEEALHRRLVRSAGGLARSALRRLRHAGTRRQPMIVPYLGFGNAGKLWVKGRVLDEPTFKVQTGDD
ncbi:MAG: hypothetical protein WKG03_04830, partial [Telluria sp.]